MKIPLNWLGFTNAYFIFKHSNTVEKQDNCTLDNGYNEGSELLWNSRIRFKGNYHKYECKIQIDNTSAWDFGDWTCEMESYVLGPFRGYSTSKVVHLIGYNTTKKRQSKSRSFDKLKEELTKV